MQMNEEELNDKNATTLFKRTLACIKARNPTIIDSLKKKRGRKKFILRDKDVKSRLKKRETTIVGRVHRESYDENEEDAWDDLVHALDKQGGSNNQSSSKKKTLGKRKKRPNFLGVSKSK